MPSPAQVHVDAALTNLSIGLRPENFTADRLAPRVNVPKKSDKYYKYGSEQLFLEDVRLGRGAETKGGDWSLSTDTFLCEEYGWHTYVYDVDRDNADGGLQLESDGLVYCQTVIERQRENRIATIYQATGSYGSANQYQLLTAAQQWDNVASASSDPQKHLSIAAKVIYGLIGRYPNTLIIPRLCAQVLALHPQVRLGKQQSNVTNTVLEPLALPPQLFGYNVVEVTTAYNSAKRGATATIVDLWSDNVILAYIDPNPGLKTLNFLTTFAWDRGLGVPHYADKRREPNKRGDRIEVIEPGLDEKVTNNLAAFMIRDVLSATALGW